MKRLLIIFAAFCCILTANAEVAPVYPHNPNARFVLYPTQNIWNFLELDTRTGKIDIVQYSINDTPVAAHISTVSQLPESADAKDGRFTLYPTNNIYNFIMLDQVNGRRWQVQWNVDPDKRFVLEIKNI